MTGQPAETAPRRRRRWWLWVPLTPRAPAPAGGGGGELVRLGPDRRWVPGRPAGVPLPPTGRVRRRATHLLSGHRGRGSAGGLRLPVGAHRGWHLRAHRQRGPGPGGREQPLGGTDRRGVAYRWRSCPSRLVVLPEGPEQPGHRLHRRDGSRPARGLPGVVHPGLGIDLDHLHARPRRGPPRGAAHAVGHRVAGLPDADDQLPQRRGRTADRRAGPVRPGGVARPRGGRAVRPGQRRHRRDPHRGQHRRRDQPGPVGELAAGRPGARPVLRLARAGHGLGGVLSRCGDGLPRDRARSGQVVGPAALRPGLGRHGLRVGHRRHHDARPHAALQGGRHDPLRGSRPCVRPDGRQPRRSRCTSSRTQSTWGSGTATAATTRPG